MDADERRWGKGWKYPFGDPEEDGVCWDVGRSLRNPGSLVFAEMGLGIPLRESDRDSAMKPGVAPPRRYPGYSPKT